MSACEKFCMQGLMSRELRAPVIVRSPSGSRLPINKVSKRKPAPPPARTRIFRAQRQSRKLSQLPSLRRLAPVGSQKSLRKPLASAAARLRASGFGAAAFATRWLAKPKLAAADARLRPSGYGAAALSRFASEGGGPGRTRTCNQTVMSGRISIRFVDDAAFLPRFDRVRCGSMSSFLVRNWCGR